MPSADEAAYAGLAEEPPTLKPVDAALTGAMAGYAGEDLFAAPEPDHNPPSQDQQAGEKKGFFRKLFGG